MNTLLILIKRNTKLFFKDKGAFFTSLITPFILLVLYSTFLGKVYKDAFLSGIPEQLLPLITDELINGFVGGQLFSSLLAVCPITVSFCSNMLMVSDKITGAYNDFKITPVKPSQMSLAYFISSYLSTLIICFVATGACLVYIAFTGWYFSLVDILYILLDVVLLVFFGTALSSLINFFLTSQGQLSAVGTVVSACYGFICGAYMPISQFGETLQKVLSFLPGTHGTSLLRNHTLNCVFEEMEHSLKLPNELIAGLRDAVDCNIYFFGNKIPISVMYAVLGGSIVLITAIYIILNIVKKSKI